MFDWFRKFLNFGAVKPLEPEARIYFSPRTAAGVYITPDRAMQNAVVWACVTYKSQTIAALPWRVHKERNGGGADIVTSNPVDWLLHRQPNPEMTAYNWRQLMVGRLMLWGNAYAEIQRNVRGQPVALWPIHPERVQPKRRENGALYYKVYQDAGGTVEIEPTGMFHARGFGDGILGLSVIEHAAQTIGWAQATEMFGATFFGNGMNPSTLIEGGPSTPQGKELLQKELNDLYTGPKNAHKTLLLGDGAKVHKLSTQPNDAQFVESMQFQVETICRWFQVPPHKVQHLLRATFSNIEHQSIEVVQDSIIPQLRSFEQEADVKLLTSNFSGLYSKINEKALLRGDMTSQATYFKTLREMGVLSVNEIRELMDLNPIGAQGDKHTMQQQYTTLERIGEDVGPAAAEPSAEPDAGAIAILPRKVNGSAGVH